MLLKISYPYIGGFFVLSAQSGAVHEIVVLKGLFSGAGSFIIALLVGEKLPDFRLILAVMLLGFIAYGLSIFTYIRAQRILGAARTSAYYAIAPFIGVMLASALVGEKFSLQFIIALAVMLTGTGFVVWDTMVKHHRHLHTHTITHIHDGTEHTHILEHSHGHNHFSEKELHSHTHTDREWQEMLQATHAAQLSASKP